MRDTKTYVYYFLYKGCLASYERLTNDTNGNPRYRVMIMDVDIVSANGGRSCNTKPMTTTSFNIEQDLRDYIDSFDN